jgi:hypothetical protein
MNATSGAVSALTASSLSLGGSSSSVVLGNGSLNSTIPLNPYNMVNNIKKFSKGSGTNTFTLAPTAVTLLALPISGSYSFAANEIQTGDYMSLFMNGIYTITTINVLPILHFTLWGKDWDNGTIVFPCSIIGVYYFTYKLDASFIGVPSTGANYTIELNTTGAVTTKIITTPSVGGLTTASASTLSFTGQVSSGTCAFVTMNMVLTKM